MDYGVLSYYVDGLMDMENPLFMARMEARAQTILMARGGYTLDQTLPVIRQLVRDLFGNIPGALIDVTVTTTYFNVMGFPEGDPDD